MLFHLLSIALLGAASLDLALAGPVPPADQIKVNDTALASEIIKGIEEAIKHLHSTPEPISMELEHTTALPAFEGVTYTYRPHRASTAQPESADDTEFLSVSTPEPETETTAHPEATPGLEADPETTEPDTDTATGSGPETTEEPETDSSSVPEDETTEDPEDDVTGVTGVTEEPETDVSGATEYPDIKVSVVIGATDATTQPTPGPEANPETEEPETGAVTESEGIETTEAPESESTSAPEDDTTGEPEDEPTTQSGPDVTEDPEPATEPTTEPEVVHPETTEEPETEDPEDPTTEPTTEPEVVHPETTEEPETEDPEDPTTEPTIEPEVEQPDTTEEPDTEDPEDPTTEPTTEPEVEQPDTTEEPEPETTTDLTVPAKESRVAGIPRSAAPEEAWEDLQRRIDPTSPYNLYNEQYYAIIERWAKDWNMTAHDDEVRDYIWTRYRIQNEVATRVLEALDGLKDYFGEYAKLAEQQDYEAETSDTYFGPSTYLNEYERPIADEILRHFTDLALRAHGIE